MARWRWQCEDDEEALGFATVLQRAGVALRTETDPAGPPTLTGDEAASELTAKILARYARADDRAGRTALQRRDRKGIIGLVAGLAALALALALVWP